MAAIEAGEICLSKGKYEEALTYFREYLNQSDETGGKNTQRRLSCMLNMGACLIASTQFKEGRITLTNVLSELEKLPEEQRDSVVAAEAHYNLAIASNSLNEPEQLIHHLNSASELFKEGGNKELAGDISCQLAGCHATNGDNGSRVASLQCALDLYSECGGHVKRKEASVGLQLVSLCDDGHQKLQILARTRLAIFSITNTAVQSSLLLKLGVIYSSLKMLDPALECFEKALPLVATAQQSMGVTQTPVVDILRMEGALLQNIGAVFNEMKKFNEAIVYHRNAADINGRLELKVEEIKCLCNLGFAQAQIRDFALSANTFSSALSIAEQLNNRLFIVQCLEGLGSACYHLKQYDKSQMYFEKALEVLSNSNAVGIAEADCGLAKERIMEKLSDVIDIRTVKGSTTTNYTNGGDDYLERMTEYISGVDSNNTSSADISVFGSSVLPSTIGRPRPHGDGVREGCLALGQTTKDIYTVRNGEIHKTSDEDSSNNNNTRQQQQTSSSSSYCVII